MKFQWIRTGYLGGEYDFCGKWAYTDGVKKLLTKKELKEVKKRIKKLVKKYRHIGGKQEFMSKKTGKVHFVVEDFTPSIYYLRNKKNKIKKSKKRGKRDRTHPCTVYIPGELFDYD